MSTIRILAVDGHPVVRAGLRAILAGEPGMAVVGEAADGPTAVRFATELTPNVVVTEVVLPGATGMETIARLCAGPDRKVLALTACEHVGVLGQFLRAGGAGYVLKRTETDELVRAIRAVAAGASYLDPAVAPAADGGARAPGVDLSERESEVVQLIARGYSNKQIAARLRVSVKTIETYKTRALEKLGVRGRIDIVRYAVTRGWLADPGELDLASYRTTGQATDGS